MGRLFNATLRVTDDIKNILQSSSAIKGIIRVCGSQKSAEILKDSQSN